MFRSTKAIISGGIAAGALAAGLTAAYNISEPVPPTAEDGQLISSWGGYPGIPQVIGNFVNQRLPEDHQADGRMAISLYNNEVGNYGIATFTAHGNYKLHSFVTCKPDHTLDFAFGIDKAQFMGRTFLKHVTMKSEKADDLAGRMCVDDELTASSIQAFEHLGKS